MEIKALKRFGQNFLKNKEKLEEIAQAADISEGDTIIEIGPGHGELTEFLAEKFLVFSDCDLTVIEKDERLVDFLNEKFKEKNIEIIKDDVLRILPELTKNLKLKTKNYKLIGNIPYYITGHLFRIISELDNKPALSVFTLQKEVAERICAKPGEMNLLSASIQIWAKPEIVSYVPKTDFEPMPKVDSAIIKLKTCDSRLTTKELKKYYDFIHLLFKQPRKMIVNNLRQSFAPEDLIKKMEEMGINLRARPQDLSVKQIIDLAKSLAM